MTVTVKIEELDLLRDTDVTKLKKCMHSLGICSGEYGGNLFSNLDQFHLSAIFFSCWSCTRPACLLSARAWMDHMLFSVLPVCILPVQEYFQYSKAGMDDPNFNYNALEHVIGAGNVMHLLGPLDTFNKYKASQEVLIFDEKTKNNSSGDAHDLIGKLMLCQTAKASGISDS